MTCGVRVAAPTATTARPARQGGGTTGQKGTEFTEKGTHLGCRSKDTYGGLNDGGNWGQVNQLPSVLTLYVLALPTIECVQPGVPGLDSRAVTDGDE